MRTAIIDMGTNTFHLLIAEVRDGNFQFLHEERLAVRIGMGGINDGRIREEAIARALNTLKNFKKIIRQYEVTKTMAFGTSAVRNAANAHDFIRQIKHATGIESKIISGEEEASLIYEGIKLAMDLGAANSLMMDIGGGSVEFIIGNKNQILWKESFEIGGQRLLEKFNPHDPILSSEIDLLNQYFTERLTTLLQALKRINPKTLVGSSGSFDTFSEMHCSNIGMVYSKTPETPLTFEAFYRIHRELISKDRAQRMEIPGMIELRVDMIVVASCLVNYILANHPFDTIRVSSFSLKEGVLAGILARK